MVKFGSDSTLEMKSEDRLELAKSYFQNADDVRKTISDDSGYNSLLKIIDDQLDMVKEKIKQIDERLKKVNDENERENLLNELKQDGALQPLPKKKINRFEGSNLDIISYHIDKQTT